ncbi:DNA cytosine methyltransferase [Pseudomonas chlororaphis]|uniref:DNA cytosine methyltransferase n=1 Tax=Pseudomonas chlororaphis TaxID=587753 RepID=UPI0015DE310F|nr:DNA cytosine methyltransferase [Pseudomonas chlororaphis]QLL15364.1 DNA cytosine methyltransferase [Pseudomonas chlororaphis subsp. aurantiaca]
MNELALFAGAGGGILGGHLLGWRTVCAVERDAYAAQVLAQRQNDGALPAFPIWSDVCSFDGRLWRGLVDVVSGGFPCTNIAICGDGAGLDGGASRLWVEQRRIVDEVRPRFVYVENSPMLTSRGLGRVLGDLAELGFDARWGVLSAYDAGLGHKRERIWIVADADGFGRERQCFARSRQEESRKIFARCSSPRTLNPAGVIAWRASQPRVQRVVDGVATAMDRHRAVGNGQVPRVAATAFALLSIDSD